MLPWILICASLSSDLACLWHFYRSSERLVSSESLLCASYYLDVALCLHRLFWVRFMLSQHWLVRAAGIHLKHCIMKVLKFCCKSWNKWAWISPGGYWSACKMYYNPYCKSCWMFWQVPPLHWASIGIGFDFMCTISYELATNQTWKMCMNQMRTSNT